MKKHIPNFLTCCSLFAGCLALVQVSQNNLEWVPYLVWIAAFFDFIDGLVARMLNVSSPMGKELDSLSDMVSFGVVPGYFMYAVLSQHNLDAWIPFVGFGITIGSALRLAKFNIDDRQTDQFIGLPTPANAIFITGLIWVTMGQESLLTPMALIGITTVFSILLNAEIRLLALKFKNYDIKANWPRYFVICSTLALLALLGLQGVSISIVVYIIISLITNQFSRSS